ncbi:MAG: MCE family protein [Marinilabiliales bacterium]|nr:MAG: MCE family protein [Marinilabiliales bacterium]
MKRKAQRTRLGIFILISSALLLIIVGLFTARRIFEQKDTYYVAYSDISVSGLDVGSPVKYLGINVGTISNIRIDPDDVSTIIVRLSLDAGTPVKKDAVADIVAIGITGLKTIEIRGGTKEAEFLEPESFIEPGSTMAADLTGRAENLTWRVEEILNNLQLFTHPDNMAGFTTAASGISELAETTSRTVAALDEMLAENRQYIRNATLALDNISSRMDGSSEELAAAIGKFNEIMQGDEISEVLGNLRDISLSVREANMKELIESLAAATMQTQSLLVRLDADFEESSMHLNENLVLLQYTLENLNEASRKINIDPSVLIRGPGTRNIPDRNLRGN